MKYAQTFTFSFCSGFVRKDGRTKMLYSTFQKILAKKTENGSMRLHKVLDWEPLAQALENE